MIIILLTLSFSFPEKGEKERKGEEGMKRDGREKACRKRESKGKNGRRKEGREERRGKTTLPPIRNSDYATVVFKLNKYIFKHTFLLRLNTFTMTKNGQNFFMTYEEASISHLGKCPC